MTRSSAYLTHSTSNSTNYRQQKQISATATVPAAASVSATENHSVVLIFVNQTVIVGHDAPSDTASTVRVTLDRVGGRWLISGFEPI